MTTHTPGPWRYKIAPNGDCGITAYDTGYFAETYADIRRAGENARDEAKANACLIAAAPKMLATLKAALAAHDYDGREGWVADARAIVAEAEGKP